MFWFVGLNFGDVSFTGLNFDNVGFTAAGAFVLTMQYWKAFVSLDLVSFNDLDVNKP